MPACGDFTGEELLGFGRKACMQTVRGGSPARNPLTQQRDAGVANHDMMPSETTSPLAHALVYCVPVGAHSNEPPPEYAGRLVQLLRRMFLYVISMLSPSARTRDA